MSYGLKISITGDRELIARLESMPPAIQAALYAKVRQLSTRLEQKVVGKLQGPVLKHRSGALSRSIFSEVTQSRDLVQGRVASSGSVKYAAIHEFGGRTKAHVIEPKKAAVLAYMAGGKMRFAKRINHPGSVMPERSFLRSSLGDMAEEIKDGLVEAVNEGLAAIK
jgi:phage gpG-like protein